MEPLSYLEAIKNEIITIKIINVLIGNFDISITKINKKYGELSYTF